MITDLQEASHISSHTRLSKSEKRPACVLSPFEPERLSGERASAISGPTARFHGAGIASFHGSCFWSASAMEGRDNGAR
jgi:hypothetical protein